MKKSKKLKPIKVRKKDKIKKYLKNLDVINEHSFFNVDNELLCIKFPVPNENYEVKNIYNYSSALINRIVIHISDNTNDSVFRGKKEFMLTGIIKFSDIPKIGNNDFTLLENSSLTVLIYNSNLEFNANMITEKDFESLEVKPKLEKAFLPNDKGGGVIVIGP